MIRRRQVLGAAVLALATAIALVGAWGGTASAIAATTTAVPDADVCVVDGADVPYVDYKAILRQARLNYHTQHQAFPKPGTRAYTGLTLQAVDYLVEQQLFREQGAKLGVVISDAEVATRLAQLKSSFFKGDEAAYDRELRHQGLTEADVIANIRQQLLSERLFDAVTKATTVTDAAAKHYYETHPAEYRQPASREVAHILVKTEALADRIDAETRGRSLAVFARYAKRYSQDPSSANTGGRLPISKGQTVPQFDTAAFALSVGEQSRPVHTQFGWHVIRALTKVRPPVVQPFAAVRQQVRQQLTQEARAHQMQDWRTAVRTAAVVSCSPPLTWTASGSQIPSTGSGTSSSIASGQSFGQDVDVVVG